MANPSCDIFCRVIDNYGDIGVAWRLARALAHERHWSVRLICDDLRAFSHLCPAYTGLPFNKAGVSVQAWSESPTPVADIVIEAFACHLPDTYVAGMAARSSAPCWINLEYLSAETWIESCHGLASVHPYTALQKYFIFPGFTPRTGGLLREVDLEAERTAWMQTPSARSHFLQNLGVADPQAFTFLLFGYHQPALGSWLEALGQQGNTVNVLIAPGPLQTLAPALVTNNRLHLYLLPFIDQRQFDFLCWSCDWLFVRGEDSFVRAQLAARPFLWQIYTQENVTHEIKLAAFHERYCQTMNSTTAEAWQDFSWAWNRGQSVIDLWPRLWAQRDALQTHAEYWCASLGQQPTLIDTLAEFWRRHQSLHP